MYSEQLLGHAKQVVDAIRVGDSDGAADWMAEHLDAIRDELKNIIT